MSKFRTNPFLKRSTSELKKIGQIIREKNASKIKVFKKNVNNGKCAPKMIFLNEKEK